jgi:hypothetical protein
VIVQIEYFDGQFDVSRYAVLLACKPVVVVMPIGRLDTAIDRCADCSDAVDLSIWRASSMTHAFCNVTSVQSRCSDICCFMTAVLSVQ